MEFDADQKYAIQADGNILVSASAGSGKTAVLTERFVRLIKDGVHPSNILVLTFSEKAAAEMRERIELKLNDYAAERVARGEGPIDVSLSDAGISTIHSFLHKLITKYFYELDIDPYFSLLTESESAAFKKKAFERAQGRYNALDDELYETAAQSLSGSRNDAGLFEAAEKYGELLTVMTDKEYDFEKSFDACGKYITAYLKERLAAFCALAAAIPDMCAGSERYLFVLDEILDKINGILAAKEESFMDAIIKTAPVSVRVTGKDDPRNETIAAFKNAFNEELRHTWQEIAGNIDEWRREAVEDRGIIEKFVEFSRYYTAKYAELKAAENKLDYADLEGFFLKLIRNSAVKNEIKSQYTHIMLDEYQDTNRIQEYILNEITGGQFFAVGDVKQSIFNFRLADPEIFLEREDAYRRGAGRRIRLNNNYRTSARVIDFINSVFSAVMTESNGGVDYAGEARLVAKTEFLPERAAPYSVKFFKKIECKTEINGLYGVIKDENFAEASAAEYEGLYIAETIEELLSKEIYAPREGRYKRVGYGDIALIFRSKKNDNARTILRVLKDKGIPLSEDAARDGACGTVLELLKVVDNMRRDIPLAAVMLSFFGGFTDRDLEEIRLNDYDGKVFSDSVKKYVSDYGGVAGGGSEMEAEYCDGVILGDSEKTRLSGYNGKILSDNAKRCVFNCKENPERDEKTRYRTALALRLEAFLKYIERLRKIAADGDLYSLLCEIVYGGGYDAYLGADGGAVGDFVESFYGYEYSLSRFIKTAAVPDAQNGGAHKSGRVSTLTMHASKGLEFPIVFLADCAKQFNMDDERGAFVFDAKLGIGFYHKDFNALTRKDGLFRRAIILKKERERREEEARLLYVAMTRAQNHLFISGGGREPSGNAVLELLKEPNSFMSFLRRAEGGAFSIEAIDGAYFLKGFKRQKKLPDISARYDEKVASYMAERLRKTAVIAEKTPLKESATAVAKGKRLTLAEPFSGLFDRGGAYHKVMQFIDFDECEIRDIEASVRRLVLDGILSEEEAALVNLYDVEKCLKSEIIEYARNNSFVREKEFMLYIPSKELYADGDDGRILVQGVIDLLILGEKNVVVDYKTGGLGGGLLEAYKKQLAVYRRAVESAGIKIDAAYIYLFGSGLIEA
ncbi:MAG: UvrD-helicase domain-containing protein [Clostridiales bacterium]|jgi:ATP-dependent helicase/nuclease subunit A|nr:UvrD-helicase domain-containing protein [Clostridiales bacterium]